MNTDNHRTRLDKWLWAARFFKTRSMATAAIRAGHVHINGRRCKPSQAIEPGNELRIRKAEQTWTIEVLAISERRGPASEAAELYRETEESRIAREAATEQRKQQWAENNAPARRPDKRQRRKIHRFKQSMD